MEFEEQLDKNEFEECGIIDLCSFEEPSREESQEINDPETKCRLKALLKEYEDIFEKPKEPPPSRPEDHAINLLNNSNIPLVRGIGRLFEAQLTILKKKIKEMSESGFIRPSNSPFGASVLFAKKTRWVIPNVRRL